MSSNTDTLHLHRRLDELLVKIDLLLKSNEGQQATQWINRKEACKLLNISDSNLMNLIERGTIKGDAFRNVGTVKRIRYRFNSDLLMNQYFSRAWIVLLSIYSAQPHVFHRSNDNSCFHAQRRSAVQHGVPMSPSTNRHTESRWPWGFPAGKMIKAWWWVRIESWNWQNLTRQF